MKPAPFAYRRPTALDEAVDLLRESGDAKVIAGGQSLVPLMNFRLARPRVLVDLGGIPGLDYIREDHGALAVGAMTRQAGVESFPLVHGRHPLLAEAVRQVGHPAIRHRGTIGGSAAHADPAAEIPCVLIATGGSLRLVGPAGARTLLASDFFLDVLQTALAPDEVVVEVRFPLPPGGCGWAFEELSRRHGDFALVMAAVILTLSDDGRIVNAGVGLGGVGPVPVRAVEAEALLRGAQPTPDAFDAAVRILAGSIEPIGDLHASAEDRRHLATVLARRGLDRALERARHSRVNQQ